MEFELREHTADVAVAATGPTLEDVFAAVANGFVAASCDELPTSNDPRFTLSVEAERRDALLFDYLDELIYQRDVRDVLPVDNRVEHLSQSADSTEWTVEANARGIPLSAVDAREIKAVTYSDMRLEETSAGWEAYVVFDV